MSEPTLEQRRQPGLSETLPASLRAPDRCSSCAAAGDLGEQLHAWQEHDPFDRPLHVVIVLCGPCAKRIVERHPRLYRLLELHEPWPGCMPICLDCAHREGTSCRHPDAKANGGAGVTITIAPPHRMHVCRGRRGSGWIQVYHAPASDCVGRTARVPA